MNSAFDVVDIDTLRPLLDRQRIIAAVRQALVWQAQGKVQSPLPGQLLFSEPHGDCHIKYGHVAGSPTFAIKVATGFYDNPRHGLPVNHGLVLIFDSRTGAPTALLKDDGWLTAWRTAAATAIAASTLAPAAVTEVGVVGTGLQATLAIEWLPDTLGEQSFVVWGRRAEAASELATRLVRNGCRVTAVARIEELLERCNVVVTSTPSRVPLFDAATVRAGTHLVALGADAPGKQELPAGLFHHAAHVLTDDHAQCLDHGDFGAAVRAGVIASDADTMLGALLSGSVQRVRAPSDITIADLTGIAAEDIAMAGLFSELLAARR